MSAGRRYVIATLFVVGCSSVTASSLRAQSLSSLHIGDASAKLSALGKPASSEPSNDRMVQRWTLPNGNDLSATTDKNNRIVYLESDWNRTDAGTGCDLPWMHFGSTTLAEIRTHFGSNGFAFKGQAGQLLAEDGAVLLNSYEVGDTVITFYNKVSNAEIAKLDPAGQSTFADHARLDAISIASQSYAQSEWGGRVYDPHYKKVDWK
ncbi:hypothetical protein Terro_0788 [Terriglobus roseus DSM 18391]|uniref:Uncharacterized protein n=1 Tax=Terriglobus roseus (strain DSM 18391 / NRRL B-41598 / KBS 63) TaxID=926566 RepID=I3ZD02_TERRK|nr:hypothetical protein [Terriglobus roseus]AFL87120.1 hypothetical protein Terro_0788 [Terriglobus roseus DSM 18391]